MEDIVIETKGANLTFQFIGNACGIFTGSNGTTILCDPWLVDGVFEGSWHHFPKLKTTFDDVQNIDAIYISHLHPDHFDERHFEFRKDQNAVFGRFPSDGHHGQRRGQSQSARAGDDQDVDGENPRLCRGAVEVPQHTCEHAQQEYGRYKNFRDPIG